MIEYARVRREDAQLIDAEVADKYIDRDIRLDAAIAAPDVIDLKWFTERVELRDAKGADTEGMA